MGETLGSGGRRRRSSAPSLIAAFALAVAVVLVVTATARADFQVESFTTAASSYVAGAHADVSTSFKFSDRGTEGGGQVIPDGHARRLEIDLPGGLVGDPTGFPRCTREQFRDFRCPAASQVGTADIVLGGFPADQFPAQQVFNMEPSAGEPALLGVNVASYTIAIIRIKVRPDGRLTAVVDDLPFGSTVVENRMTLWGVPADHNRSGAERRPFMANGTSCLNTPVTSLRVWSYEDGARPHEATSTNQVAERCDTLAFAPTMTAQATQRNAGGPTGLDVDLRVPQSESPDARATAHVRGVQIALPHGMSVSPSAATGLAACSEAAFGYGTNSAVTCPDGSKIGTVAVDTPLLDTPLDGSVYLAAQNANPFSSLLAMYIVAQGNGVTIKLAGRVDPDPVTGRLTATFESNPELPFSRLNLSLKSGPRAPLANPQTCGTYQSETRITSWAGHTVTATTPLTIDQDCKPVGFSPSFDAGSINPVGGTSSKFSLTFGRGDHDQELRDITVSMPEGLTGKLALAEICADGPAASGACSERARIGSVTTGAGPGPSPVYISGGRVYLTGPYNGAPLGLSIVVPAVAGPFDLGTVVVRAGIHVDRTTAALRVVADPLPRILQGIPLLVRTVNVAIDKPGFMINPTNCNPKRIDGRIMSQNGRGADVSSRFQVGSCTRMPITPKLSLEVGARGRTAAEMTTPLTATLTQTPGQGNLRNVSVKLPTILNSRLEVVNQRHACSIDQYRAERCPNAIGSASAVTPLLRDPLVGQVFLLRNPARRLPDMVVRLRGQGITAGIKVDLIAKITIGRDLSLINTFDTVPDVPISRFVLRLIPGRNGAIGAVRNLCTADSRRARAALSFRGQNGKLTSRKQQLQIRGCAASGKKTNSTTRRASK